MKKVLITRRLIRESEDKASKLFDAKFNTNDELYSQKKIIEMSQGFDGILSSCLLYTSPSPRDGLLSRMPSSA